MEAVVLHKVGVLKYFCPKQGQDFKPSAAPMYPNMGQVPPPFSGGFTLLLSRIQNCTKFRAYNSTLKVKVKES